MTIGHTYSLPLGKVGVPMQIHLNLVIYLLNKVIKCLGPHPLESVLGAENDLVLC